MTNYEKTLLTTAKEHLTTIGTNEEVDLALMICNGMNLSCSRCPLSKQCSPNPGTWEKLNEWLKLEVDND